MNILRIIVLLTLLIGQAPLRLSAAVRVYPAPAGEDLSRDFQVTAEGQSVPVYIARVASADPAKRWKAMDDKTNSASYFDTASLATFDMEGPITITVTCPEAIRTVKILPSSFNITPRIQGKSLSLNLSEPRLLTIEVNGEWTKSLHVFANPPETSIPRKEDPNVLYFGPGIHEVSHLVITNNQTVYVAGGAIVRGIIHPDEPFRISGYSGLKTYPPTFSLRGTNITFRGRGIVDGGRSTTHARNLLSVQGTNIHMEGVVLRDSSTWTIPVRQSEQVQIKNMKLLGYRANSDGIDICNSRNITVEGCFIRTLDDLIVVKTDQQQGKSAHIIAKDCVLWNEVAHALSIGAELRQDVEDVLFTNCDVIHDKGREWTLRIYHCDSARISNIRFENIRIEESPRLISLWIGQAVWTRDSARGHIDNITFRNIQAQANPLKVEFKGFDSDHCVENVLLDHVLVNNTPLTLDDIKTNAFVRQVSIKP